jgi:1-acyl-sn-glycerol-3-phosphate acyltransferase
MHRTVFDTPVIRTLLYVISLIYLKIFGWRRVGQPPEISRYVMIAAPHTSNWDMPVTLALAFSFRVKVYWMGKDTLFNWPFGTIMKWLGGIPIDRSKSNNIVEQYISAFNEHDNLVMIIPPEGTRKSVRYWKTGFYNIAYGAGVPIVLGFLDFAHKTGGIGPVVWPTGDINADMRIIQNFYAGITGKYPDEYNPAEISPEKKQSQNSMNAGTGN